MLRHLFIALTTLAFSASGYAACPEYLDHSMRKLHSKDQVNLCEAQTGRPMLIINTASHCGSTKQFKGLEALHQKYGEQGLARASQMYLECGQGRYNLLVLCSRNLGVESLY